MALTLMGATGSSVNAMSFLNTEIETEIAQPQYTVLPDKLNTITGTLDNDLDVKIYSFVARRGQNIMLDLTSVNAQSPWHIETKQNGSWTTEVPGTTWIKSGSRDFLLKVSKKHNFNLANNEKYKIIFGSAPYLASGSGQVRGDTTNLPLDWGTTQFYQNLIWSAQLNDSKGHPVEGATIVLDLIKDNNSPSSVTLIEVQSNNAGKAHGYTTIGKCFGNHKSKPFITYNGSSNYRWIVEYNKGSWIMYVKGNKASGIGSRATITVSTAHICNQIMLR